MPPLSLVVLALVLTHINGGLWDPLPASEGGPEASPEKRRSALLPSRGLGCRSQGSRCQMGMSKCSGSRVRAREATLVPANLSAGDGPSGAKGTQPAPAAELSEEPEPQRWAAAPLAPFHPSRSRCAPDSSVSVTLSRHLPLALPPSLTPSIPPLVNQPSVGGRTENLLRPARVGRQNHDAGCLCVLFPTSDGL